MSATAPTVVACLSAGEWDSFLAPVMVEADPAVVIERCDSAGGTDALIAVLARTRVTTLLTCWSTPPLPADLLARVPTLRYLCHLCGSVRALLPRSLIDEGLLVSNWGASISRVVAEHCLMQMLAGLRRVAASQQAIHHDAGWAPPGREPRSLFHRRVGLHGFGNVARELVRLLAPFACAVTAYAPGDDDRDLAGLGVARAASLDALYAESEVLVCLAPLLPATRGSVDEALLRRLPEGALFINTGRGAVVDEAALARVAAEGRIELALDVFDHEPPPADSPLRALHGALLTPHIAGPTPDRRRDAGRHALANLALVLRGGRPRAVIDVRQYDRQT